MTDTYKTLGQAVSNGASLVDAYTVPASTAAIVSSVVFANRTAVDDFVSVYVRVAGAAINSKQQALEWVRVPANGILACCEGITLAATDKLSFASASGTTDTVSCNVFGVEQSPVPSAAPKVLGQYTSVAGTLQDLYTVPAAKSAVVSSLMVQNLTDFEFTQSVNNLIRAAVSVGGGAVATKDYLLFDYALACDSQSNPSPTGSNGDATRLQLPLAITLAAGDKFRVRGSIAGCAFNLFGVEIT